MREIWIGNEKVKLFTFADDTIIYIENSKGATRPPEEKPIIGNKFNKLQNTKLIYRNLLHYYNDKVAELEVKTTVAFAVASKRKKYLGINLKRWKICTLKSVKLWWKKLKITRTNGKMFCAHGLKNEYCLYVQQVSEIVCGQYLSSFLAILEIAHAFPQNKDVDILQT